MSDPANTPPSSWTPLHNSISECLKGVVGQQYTIPATTFDMSGSWGEQQPDSSLSINTIVRPTIEWDLKQVVNKDRWQATYNQIPYDCTLVVKLNMAFSGSILNEPSRRAALSVFQDKVHNIISALGTPGNTKFDSAGTFTGNTSGLFKWTGTSNLRKLWDNPGFLEVLVSFTCLVVINKSAPRTVLGEYDEGFVYFTGSYGNAVSVPFPFSFTFTQTPVCVLTMESGSISGNTNVNLYGLSLSTTGAVAGVSAPFSGTLRYRALFANSYQAWFTGSITPTSSMGIFTGSAGVFNYPGQVLTFFTGSWNSLDAPGPNFFLATPFPEVNPEAGGDASCVNIALTTTASNMTVSSIPVDSSGPVVPSVGIDFVALKVNF